MIELCLTLQRSTTISWVKTLFHSCAIRSFENLIMRRSLTRDDRNSFFLRIDSRRVMNLEVILLVKRITLIVQEGAQTPKNGPIANVFQVEQYCLLCLLCLNQNSEVSQVGHVVSYHCTIQDCYP